MTTHKEALKKADHVLATMRHNGSLKDLEDAIRAYLEARGLVMVPKEPTADMHSVLWREGCEFPFEIYRAMLAAAPDPFKE